MTVSSPQQITIDSLHRSLIWALMIMVVTAVIGCTILVVLDPGGEVADNFYATSALVPLGLGACLAAVSVIRRGRARELMILSMILTAGGGIVLILAMWHYSLTGQRPNKDISRLGLAVFIGGVVLAHSGAMHVLVPANTAVIKFFRAAVVVMTWLFAVIIVAALLLEELGIANSMGLMFFFLMVWSLLGAGSVLGTIIVPVAAISQANRRVESDQALDPRMKLTLACPKCGERQSPRAGFHRCAKCRVSMFVELEEPRCECGYLLYQLSGSTCPECGRSIVKSQPAQVDSRAAGAATADSGSCLSDEIPPQ